MDVYEIVGEIISELDFLVDVNAVADEEEQKLEGLRKEYEIVQRELEEYIERWKKNARVVNFGSSYYEDTDSWSPSLDYSCSYETLEYDGIRVTHDPDDPLDLDLKLRQALEKANDPIIVKLKEIESKIEEIENEINQKYEKLFDEQMKRNEKARALFSLLTDLSYLDPFKPILEKYVNREIMIPVTTTISVTFKPTSVEELAKKIRSHLLGIIDPYDNCFGDLRTFKNYKRKFIEFLITLSKAEPVKVVEYRWIDPLNDIRTFMVVVRGDFFGVRKLGYKLAEKIAKEHGCRSLYSKSVGPINVGDGTYKMVYHFV